MKKLFFLVSALVWVMTAYAQTGLEIVNSMNQMMSDRKSQGICVSVDVKIPVLGTITTKTYSLGKKSRLEIESSKKTQLPLLMTHSSGHIYPATLTWS